MYIAVYSTVPFPVSSARARQILHARPCSYSQDNQCSRSAASPALDRTGKCSSSNILRHALLVFPLFAILTATPLVTDNTPICWQAAQQRDGSRASGLS